MLFVPGDHFLTAALQTDSTLLDRAIAKKVLLATPTTLIALLKAAAYGRRQEAVSKNADEVSRLGRDLYDRIVTFAEHLDKVGRGLESALKSYNSAVGSFEGSVLPGARRFEELGAKGQKKLTDPVQAETAPAKSASANKYLRGADWKICQIKPCILECGGRGQSPATPLLHAIIFVSCPKRCRRSLTLPLPPHSIAQAFFLRIDTTFSRAR